MSGLCDQSSDRSLDQAGSDGTVASGHELAAWATQHILSDLDAVAGGAAVGVHSKAMLADAAHFGTEIADAHFAGLAFGQCLTILEGRKNTESLGFGIDVFHA